MSHLFDCKTLLLSHKCILDIDNLSKLSYMESFEDCHMLAYEHTQ